MTATIELAGVENAIKDSEMIDYKSTKRNFIYNLNEKTAKGKLLKGAKRSPMDIVENSTSCNIIFSLGAWSTVVIPSLFYWSDVKGEKSCTIGGDTIRVLDVKFGKDLGGRHVDTQVVFAMNHDKITLHCYNTTQLILANGRGYLKLVEVFLKPYFHSKIQNNSDDINIYNEHAISTLGPKKVKRSSISTKTSSLLTCENCEFTSLTKVSLLKHKKSKHDLSLSNKLSHKSLLSLPKYQSTTNNSVAEVILQ